jgi:hypothetical protein
MDTRGFFGLAFLCLCITAVYGTISSQVVITSDKMIDDITRKVVVGLSITTSASAAEERPRVCSGTIQALTTKAGVTSAVTEGSTSGCSTSTNADCTLPVTITFTFSSSYCAGNLQFSDDLAITYNHCDDTTDVDAPAHQTATIHLNTRDVCSNSQASISAAIVKDGPWANSGFTDTKNPYFIGDVVYFPFKVTYTGLSIAKVTFYSIGVTAGSSSPVYLYDPLTAAPTASGSAVQLHTEPLSQLNSGTATVWFSIKLTRDAGSPFADALGPDTLYAFDVVFDVEYKNAKRNLAGREVEEEKQISSRAYIRVSDQVPSEPSEVIESLPLIASVGYTVQVGLVVVLFSFILALF